MSNEHRNSNREIIDISWHNINMLIAAANCLVENNEYDKLKVFLTVHPEMEEEMHSDLRMSDEETSWNQLKEQLQNDGVWRTE